MATMTFSEWQTMARQTKERADRITAMMMDDARATATAAGLDGSIIGIHVHNALVSLAAGKPWPEVNYKLARRAAWLMERSYLPHRIADRIVSRAWARVAR